MDNRKLYDEEHELPHPWEWVVVVLFSASIVAYGLVVYYLVPDGPRMWDVGQLPDTPAEAIYSTETAPRQRSVPPQVQRLPEALPLPPVKSPNEQQHERGPQR